MAVDIFSRFFHLHAAMYIVLHMFMCHEVVNGGECSRTTSRLVRSFFHQKTEGIYSEHRLLLPASCPFSVHRDRFGYQETYRHHESGNKWTCEFCGKSFFDSLYLDRHFDRKHSDKALEGDQVVCLDDFCDWMRCDVLTGKEQAHFWDHALCQQSLMNSLSLKCHEVMNDCIPEDIDYEKRSVILDQLNASLCSYLTCDRYWERDNEQTTSWLVVYILLGAFLSFALFIYYYVAYTHFYTDESLLDDICQPAVRHHANSQRSLAYMTPPSVRHRQHRGSW